jgi:hypothetical protein
MLVSKKQTCLCDKISLKKVKIKKPFSKVPFFHYYVFWGHKDKWAFMKSA